jgi:hypothetical protein
MINKINKERWRSTNATPTRSSNKSQWQDRGKGMLITETIYKKKQSVTDKELIENN